MDEKEEYLNRLYRAIGDTTRRRIIDELGRQNRQSLFEIYARVLSEHAIAQSRQAFSRHLSTLEEVGIIEIEWQGKTKLHSLNTKPLCIAQAGWLSQFEEET